MEITNSVVIDRSVPVVFAAWSELERIPDWYVDSLERTKTSEGPVGVGTTYHAVDKIPPGRRIEGTLEITRYEPDALMAASLSDPYNTTWEASFEENQGSTLMTMRMVPNLAGMRGLLAPLLSWWAGRVSQRGLDSFKADVESR
ncbi:MAG: hypothetical protein BMS9Abin07_0307 [Acidimicrobiia bacterium]|nr:MAG: hypothetical protein BMS9Abin07_0307 [Acidimicrobiia bacterium]